MAARRVPNPRSMAAPPALAARPAARPYQVARSRAKVQLKEALDSRSGSARERRIRQVLASDRLDREDPESRRLLLAAAREIRQLAVAQQKQAALAQEQQGGAEELLQLDASTRGQAPSQSSGGDYTWIRKANDAEDRAARLEISSLTHKATEQGGYQLGSAKVRLSHVKAMLAGTCLFSPSLPKATWPDSSEPTKRSWACKTDLSVIRGTVIEVAVAQALAGHSAVAVNAASSYHAGGGFLTGGRHALEEAMCVQSSLFPSLEKGVQLAEAAGVSVPSWVRPPRHRDGSEWVSHLPHDGVLFSPFVEVFRSGTNDGYTFLDAPVKLEAIVSVAMPNCNERMSDSPVDAHTDNQKYETQLMEKWRAVLAAAAYGSKATHLVVPDAGCGVFRNPPEKVGRALGEVLREEFAGRFQSVIVAFPGGSAGETFASAASAAFNGSVQASSDNKGFCWEFSVKEGFKPFDDDCQASVEAQYQRFSAEGGPAQAKVTSRGHTIVVDFKTMTQHVEGSDRTRNVRRTC